MRNTKIFIEPYNLQVKPTYRGFKIIISGKAKNGKNTYNIYTEFPFSWIDILIKGAKEALSSKIDELNGFISLFKWD